MVKIQNLSEEIKNTVLRHELTQVEGVTAEQEMSVKLALPRVISLVLSSLAQTTTRANGQQEVYQLATQAYEREQLEASSTKREVALVPEPGAELAKSLLKDQYFGTINNIATATGVQQKTVVGLLSLVVPTTLALLGQQATEQQWQAGGLAGFLQTSYGQPQGAALVSQPVGSAPPERWEKATPAPSAVRSNKWLIAALVVATAELGYIIGSKMQDADRPEVTFRPNTDNYTTPAVRVGNKGIWDPNNPAALTANGNFDRTGGGYVYGDAGVPAVLKLKDGLQQIIGSNSTENKLYQFLVDPRVEVDTDSPTKGWVGFDRIYFESSKAVLTNESMWQLSNVASILKTFPSAKVRIGGYTDSSGNPISNLKLSRERAEAAKATLLKFGVDPSSVEAIGYGALDNIASNATPDGRSLNRRVSIRVMEK